MASAGSPYRGSPAMQNYNHELVQELERLREEREEMNRGILRDEEEKAQIKKELDQLHARMARIEDDLDQLVKTRTEFDTTIQESEGAYMKILESSQTLLNVLRRESQHLQRSQEIVMDAVRSGGGAGAGRGAPSPAMGHAYPAGGHARTPARGPAVPPASAGRAYGGGVW